MPRTMTAEREAYYRQVLERTECSQMVREGWSELDAERSAHTQTAEAAKALASALKLARKLPLPWMEEATSITFQEWNHIWEQADAALAKYMEANGGIES